MLRSTRLRSALKVASLQRQGLRDLVEQRVVAGQDREVEIDRAGRPEDEVGLCRCRGQRVAALDEAVRQAYRQWLLPRATVVAVSALVAAVGGTLFALYNAYVTPGLLHWTLSGEALIIAIIGGTRAFWGPALGAFVFVCLRDVVGNYTTHWQAIVGIVLIAVVIAAPNGLSGAIRARRCSRYS